MTKDTPPKKSRSNSQSDSKSDSYVLTARKTLQEKVGSGPLNHILISECQKIIDDNNVDFAPLGFEILGNLDNTAKDILLFIDQSPQSDIKHGTKEYEEVIEQFRQELIEPFMELKANASIFHYPLIGELATVLLSFLESIKDLDRDVIDIAKVFRTTATLVIAEEMKGSVTSAGQEMIEEIKAACARYYEKKDL